MFLQDFVWHINPLGSQWTWWCNKMFNSSFLCFSINWRIKSSKVPSEKLLILFTLAKLLICSVVTIVIKLKKYNKVFTLLLWKLKIQRLLTIHSIDTFQENLSVILDVTFAIKKSMCLKKPEFQNLLKISWFTYKELSLTWIHSSIKK